MVENTQVGRKLFELRLPVNSGRTWEGGGRGRSKPVITMGYTILRYSFLADGL